MSNRLGRALALIVAAGGLATAAQAQSLQTVFVSNNGGAALWTVYFDITVNSTTTINQIAVNTSAAVAAPVTLNVYTTNVGGTYVGNTSNAGVWTLQGTGAGTSAGQDQPSVVDVSDFVLGPGTYGMAIRYMDAVPRYTNGNGTNQNFSNADMALVLGASQATVTGPFLGGTPFSPRVANVRIDYSLGGVTGACCLGAPNYNCVITTQASCTAQGGTYAGDNITCAAANCPPPPTGACCVPAGTCSVITQAACLATPGGVYAGNNITCAAANCPQPGACCLPNGTCSQLPTASCTAANGVYSGNNTLCGNVTCNAFGYTENGDTGDVTGTAQVISGNGSAALTKIFGTIGTAGDTDMYQIQVCDAANFSATSVGGTTIDTVMAMFKADGRGVSFNDDEFGGTTLQSKITSQFVAPAGNGLYYIAVCGWNHIPASATGNIWINDGVAFPYRSERAPDGPGAADPMTGWNTSTSTATGAYTLTLTGSCFVGGSSCYANCDGSSVPPILNSLDFGCFLTKFAQGDTYANCDGSTVAPTLNSLDFGCFLTKFAAGCT